MGSRILIVLAVCWCATGCLVDRELYEERRDALSGANDLDGDGFLASVDCDDGNSAINPGADEIYYNDVDEDCDVVLTPDGDRDADGALFADDCDDQDPLRSPFFPESPYDGVDNDCADGTPDDDLDDDGFLLEDDCDDTDATVNPEGEEVPYDGDDDDCDPGTPDDDRDFDGALAADDCDDLNPDRILAEDLHLDVDADGFGDPVVHLIGCAGDPLPAGTVTDATDCNDLNAYVNPTTLWYGDADLDGYGTGPGIVACDPGPGFALVASDCDDGDASIVPGALDPACGDGLSGGCGPDPACHEPPPASFDLDVLGAGGPRAGFLTTSGQVAVAGAGDANADGFPDLALADESAGSVSFFDGRALTDDLIGSASYATVSGNPSLAATLAWAGDVDGDGFDDLLVGAPLAPPDATAGLGRLFVVFGPPGADYFGVSDPPVVINVGLVSDPGLGATVGSAGDVDGDGFDDMLVGAAGGKSWLVMGSPARLESGPIADVRQLSFFDGLAPQSALGHVDIDGDGLDDVVVGMPAHGALGGGSGAVAVYGGDVIAALALATEVKPSNTACLLLTGTLPNELAGTSVAGGDVNGDGIDDLLVGAPGYEDGEGRAFVFTGATNVKTDATASLEASFLKISGFPGGAIGQGVAVVESTSAGDEREIVVGGDGFASLLPATFLAGSFSLDSLEASRTTAVGIGADVAAAGDIDRDGFGDVLVGRADPDGDITAGAWLLFGTE